MTCSPHHMTCSPHHVTPDRGQLEMVDFERRILPGIGDLVYDQPTLDTFHHFLVVSKALKFVWAQSSEGNVAQNHDIIINNLLSSSKYSTTQENNETVPMHMGTIHFLRVMYMYKSGSEYICRKPHVMFIIVPFS